MGFDDIQAAAYVVPSLTTIRQPLQQMGSMAASLLLKKLAHEKMADIVKIDPELVVRESTAQAPGVSRIPGGRATKPVAG
jgi:LacI family transcriptional regulator